MNRASSRVMKAINRKPVDNTKDDTESVSSNTSSKTSEVYSVVDQVPPILNPLSRVTLESLRKPVAMSQNFFTNECCKHQSPHTTRVINIHREDSVSKKRHFEKPPKRFPPRPRPNWQPNDVMKTQGGSESSRSDARLSEEMCIEAPYRGTYIRPDNLNTMSRVGPMGPALRWAFEE
ncbi:hypothetical protein FOL47_007990 [Perkinsus chesapeaki]|uniref:Uncharacterized protein n=1 Tax=Perkinsus chesapeaki TaxID=330153 RepID=A0A7J6LGI1_PERCH|nr:hypothetical protein FOL47_007990 [Perkinsus chesapeaki]